MIFKIMKYLSGNESQTHCSFGVKSATETSTIYLVDLMSVGKRRYTQSEEMEYIYKVQAQDFTHS